MPGEKKCLPVSKHQESNFYIFQLKKKELENLKHFFGQVALYGIYVNTFVELFTYAGNIFTGDPDLKFGIEIKGAGGL